MSKIKLIQFSSKITFNVNDLTSFENKYLGQSKEHSVGVKNCFIRVIYYNRVLMGMTLKYNGCSF